MKKILLSTLIIIIGVTSNAQNIDERPPIEKHSYTFIIIDSIHEGKDQLYIKAKSWLAKVFVSAKSVIQMDDKEAGKIIGKGMISYDDGAEYYTTHFAISYTLTINVKDNKYRLILSDFINGGYTEGLGKIGGCGLMLDDEKFLALPYSNGVLDKVNSQMQPLAESFKRSMKATSWDNF